MQVKECNCAAVQCRTALRYYRYAVLQHACAQHYAAHDDVFEHSELQRQCRHRSTGHKEHAACGTIKYDRRTQ
jgi:hypothetical protein